MDSGNMNNAQLTLILNECNCTMADVTGRSRKASIVEARQIIAYIMRMDDCYYHEITRTINRDRSTAIYSVERVYKLLSIGDKRTKYLIERLKELENEKE